MWIYIVIGIVIATIVFVIYKEYQNEKRYRLEQEAKRRKRRQKLSPKVEKRTSPVPRTTKEETKNEAKPRFERETTPKKESEETVKKRETQKTVPNKTKKESVVTTPAQKSVPLVAEENKTPPTQLPSGEYPDFSYQRLLDMGLSDEEAQEFVQELIPQIDEQIPKIEAAMEIPDYHKMERLTHSIKGSSTNIGEGGVADVLVDYNTYLKTGKDMSIIRAYHKHLITYLEKLKKRFSK